MRTKATHPIFTRIGVALAALQLLLACLFFLPSTALADGDPGSDVLLNQNLFAGWDANLTAAQQLELGKLLNATTSAGAPVRVAIIAHPDDLGTVGALWRQPQTYAKYLGYELSLAYSGRLLVVMPNGYGVYWHADPAGATKLARLLSGAHPSSDSSAALTTGTVSMVDRIETAAGVAATKLGGRSSTSPTVAVAPGPAATAGTPPAAHSQATNKATSGAPWVILVVILIAAALTYVAVRSGRLRSLRPRRSEPSDVDAAKRRRRLAPVLAGSAALVAVVSLALIVNQTESPRTATASGAALATNPYVDPGTSLHERTAPPFTLLDESGRKVSLSSYRGKVVILSFVDAECQTICPLTTQAMLDAKAALGKAGRQVQLLGINANWKSTLVDDVLSYTELHGLAGRWHFLTGTVPQLEHVWSSYNVNEKALEDAGSNNIEHVAATYVINRQGKLSALFTTQPSYASIGQMGEVLARAAAKLLPGHPRVGQNYSYGEIHGITPDQRDTLPKLGGGSARLGPGKAHLYLFFATWDTQTAPLAADLESLQAYRADARLEHLPALTAIDEGSVEPSPGALPAFVKSLPSPLSYPVAIDDTGRVADGYDVEGEPWFVETNAAGRIVWYQEVYTQGWPTTRNLIEEVRAGLKTSPSGPISSPAAKLALAGSPAPLAALHAQSSLLLPGGQGALDARIAGLRGRPVVINVWASWCLPCQKEFAFFSRASVLYGKRVAFLGADTEDQPPNARAFLRRHPVSYPSYSVTDTSIDHLLPGGLQGTPTTIFIGSTGKILSVHAGEYDSLAALEQDIQNAALGSN